MLECDIMGIEATIKLTYSPNKGGGGGGGMAEWSKALDLKAGGPWHKFSMCIIMSKCTL